MRHLKRNLGYLAVVAGVFCAMPASATTWNSSGHSAASNPGACLTSGMPNTDLQYCQMTVTVSGQVLKVRAYSTRGLGSDGLWRSAQIQEYDGGGFAVKNVAVDANNNILDSGEDAQPEHAADNTGAYDMLVFELPDAGFDIEAFKLGWAQEGATYGYADIQAWFGGNDLGNDFNFSSACFTTGCSNTSSGGDPTGGTLAHLGLTDITSTMNNPGGTGGDGGSNTPVDTTINFDGVQSGKYLVLAGKLSDPDDFFKVKSISGSPGGPGSAPTPGTVALLGLGLAGLVTMRRRKQFS